jgi:hypothetical protein
MTVKRDELELICEMAAYHCSTIAMIGEAGRKGKPTEELIAEAGRAYESLTRALHRAGYLERCPVVAEADETTTIPCH